MPSLLEPSATSSFFIPPPPHIPSLFPYTTLFRSGTEAERFRTEVDGQFGTLDRQLRGFLGHRPDLVGQHGAGDYHHRSEEHTSELQSRGHLVCRLLLEKKNNRTAITPSYRSRHRR